MLHALHHAACCFSKSRKAERILWRVRPGELSQATHCTRGATPLTYYNIYTYLFIYTSSHIISHRLTSSHIVSDRLTSSHIVSHRLTSSHIVSHHQSHVRTVQFWVNCVTMWIVWMCWIWGVQDLPLSAAQGQGIRERTWPNTRSKILSFRMRAVGSWKKMKKAVRLRGLERETFSNHWQTRPDRNIRNRRSCRIQAIVNPWNHMKRSCDLQPTGTP
jgi:hypothetical protein